MNAPAFGVVTIFVAAFATAAHAQDPIDVRVSGGIVSVKADRTPATAILLEWARVGGVAVTGAEQIPAGVPLTLVLTDVPEGQLLDALLGGVTGYVATLRPGPYRAGTSVYERLQILGTSAPPAGGPEPPRRPLDAVPPMPIAEVPNQALTAIPRQAAEKPAEATLQTILPRQVETSSDRGPLTDLPPSSAVPGTAGTTPTLGQVGTPPNPRKPKGGSGGGT